MIREWPLESSEVLKLWVHPNVGQRERIICAHVYLGMLLLIFFNWSRCANYFICLIIVNKLLSDTSTVLHFVMTSIAQGRWGKLKSIYVWIMQGQIKNLLTGSTCCTLCIRNESSNAAYSAKNNREGIINHKQKTF